jgi:serine protease Do
MPSLIEKFRTKQGMSRVFASFMALALVASIATYEGVRPTVARAATATSNTAPLDDNSVGALLNLDRAMETLAARVTPAIVHVAVTSRAKADEASGEAPEDMQKFFGQFFGPGMGQGMGPGMGSGHGRNFRMVPQQQQIEHGVGSGVIISPDGYIVTNNHVVDGATEIRVTMNDRRILPAKLIGTDPLTDLAVIKVSATELPNVAWGDSTKLRAGQTVLAFGNPFGLRFTVTRGIVSALNRPNPDLSDRHKPGEFIQTDAAINPGNSGGPLVDARGEVIGINTFLISPSGSFSGAGFAIPTQIVKPTVDTLIRDGKIEHGYMGVGIADVTPENAKFFEVTDNLGALVTQVEPDSPGAKAGLRVGDVVKRLNGKSVSDAGELQVEVGQKMPGTTIHLQVLRDGKNVEVPVTLANFNHRKEEVSENTGEHGKARWGLGLADLTPDTRDQIQAPGDVKGALIEQVQPGSSAEEAGLQPGDVILEVNRHKVQTAADVQQDLGKVPAGQNALLLIWSNGGNSFRVLHPTQS